jgi:hypothetical protein
MDLDLEYAELQYSVAASSDNEDDVPSGDDWDMRSVGSQNSDRGKIDDQVPHSESSLMHEDSDLESDSTGSLFDVEGMCE